MLRIEITRGFNFLGKALILNCDNKNDFESLYFSLLRLPEVWATGIENEKTVFIISDSEEQLNKKAKILHCNIKDWVHPTVYEFCGLLNQFYNQQQVINLLNVSRTTILHWKKTGKIDFFKWSFLLNHLMIKRPYLDIQDAKIKDPKIIIAKQIKSQN